MTTLEMEVDNWKALPWKRFQKIVFSLQTRIFKARKNGDRKLVTKLQKLLLNSKAAKYLAVRQVTQLNQGKATAGVDGKTALNCKERMQLAQDLANSWKKWEHRKLRRVSIPKKDGTKRKLGIPTIGDRAYQCLLKFALEPAAEATFSGDSYFGKRVEKLQQILRLDRPQPLGTGTLDMEIYSQTGEIRQKRDNRGNPCGISKRTLERQHPYTSQRR